ncbi:Fc.00g090250.m01.CDS01 [Cosmosporella sp. VM-42]
MLSRSQPVDATQIPLGQRRGISDLARIALDLTWAPQRAEYKAAAPSRAYPSPPMSGSPSLSSKSTQAAGDRGQALGGYPTTSPQDAYRGPSNQQPPNESRGPPNMPPSLPRLFQQELQERMPYGYQRTEDPLSRPSQYPPPGVPGISHQQNYLPAGGPNAGAAYPAPSRPLTAENQQMGSPKSQRKTKGHVASACVPCKRAHLR